MRFYLQTDDGAVWWVSGLVIAQPMNGIFRTQDLTGDQDANGPPRSCSIAAV